LNNKNNEFTLGFIYLLTHINKNKPKQKEMYQPITEEPRPDGGSRWIHDQIAHYRRLSNQSTDPSKKHVFSQRLQVLQEQLLEETQAHHFIIANTDILRKARDAGNYNSPNLANARSNLKHIVGMEGITHNIPGYTGFITARDDYEKLKHEHAVNPTSVSDKDMYKLKYILPARLTEEQLIAAKALVGASSVTDAKADLAKTKKILDSQTVSHEEKQRLIVSIRELEKDIDHVEQSMDKVKKNNLHIDFSHLNSLDKQQKDELVALTESIEHDVEQLDAKVKKDKKLSDTRLHRKGVGSKYVSDLVGLRKPGTILQVSWAQGLAIICTVAMLILFIASGASFTLTSSKIKYTTTSAILYLISGILTIAIVTQLWISITKRKYRIQCASDDGTNLYDCIDLVKGVTHIGRRKLFLMFGVALSSTVMTLISSILLMTDTTKEVAKYTGLLGMIFGGLPLVITTVMFGIAAFSKHLQLHDYDHSD